MRAPLIGLCLACWACGSPQGDDAGADARDAGNDARDAGRDAGRDASRDTASPDGADAASDAGPDPLAWTPLSGLPEGCVIEYAEHPEALATLVWMDDERCGSGCRRLVARSDVYQGGPSLGLGTVDADFDGDHGWFAMKFERRDLLDTGPRILAVADTEGTIHGAWRGPSPRDRGSCIMGTPNSRDGWVGFAVHVLVGSVGEETREERLYHAPLDALVSDLEPIGLYPASASLPGDNVFQNVRVSDTTIIAQVQPLGRIRVERPSGGDWLAGRGTPTPGSPQAVHVVGAHVLWLDWISSTGVRIAHEAQGGGEELYHDPADATITTLSTDGEVVVWTQTYGYIGPGVFDARELWWAPYVRNADELEPRRVVSQFLTNTCVAGGGHCASFAGVRNFDLYRLSDGEKSRYTVPGPVVSDAAWVAEDHVAFVTSMDEENTLLIVPHTDFVPAE